MTLANILAGRSGRLTKWPWFCGLLGLLLAPAALATDPLYENDAVLNYVVPGNPPPTIDATNFVNTGSFSVDLDNAVNTVTVDYYEPWNVRNYTNTGFMSVSTDDPLQFYQIAGFYFGIVPTFQFDTQTNSSFSMPHQMAASFYNSGEIDSEGQLIVWATNIVNPGTIDMMGTLVDPVLQFTGGNVDLTRGVLTVGNSQSVVGVSEEEVAVFSAYWGFGTDTNQDWNPGNELTATTADSSWPDNLYLGNSTSYFDFQFPATNLTVIRAVFLQDTSPGVAHNVYFDAFNGGGNGLYDGAANVEWISATTNAATCDTTTQYLYLTDFYVLGASTNVNFDYYYGTPDNFSFVSSTTRLLYNPATPFFLAVFPYTAVTNPYSYFDGQLITTTAPTNATPGNPSGAVTNLPGRIQITAGTELNLSLASISGQNYLSLTSTNQFDGSVGARISAPYSDISLGVTNGFLVITNLLESTIPGWSGYVDAWSTRWLTIVTNYIGTNSYIATNDYRVLLVGSSQLSPGTAPQVRNLTLHATNSLVITDVLNVYGSLFMDPQNLTLTTNGCGNGATSLEGEVNLMSSAILWQSALPNVRNLTNNGAIHAQNLCVFGGPQPANYTNFINHGLISDQGSTIYANNFLSSGIISNGTGSFVLQSMATVLTNGAISAGGDVSITTGSLVTSNLLLQAGRALTLQVTNFLTDNGVTNGNFWSVGGSGVGGSDSGFNLLLLPNSTNRSDLLGTTVTNIAPPNKNIINTWAGLDYGISPAGYTNNVAIGRLVLDSRTNAPYSLFTFNGTGGTGVSNAIYVDELVLLDYASYSNSDLSGNLPALGFNNNLVIYYAQALAAGPGGTMISVAEKLNHKNNDHLRWLWMYAGHFSSTNIVYPDGTTNGPFNAALASSKDIDSDGDGLVNGSDPTPFYVPSEVNFKQTLTNQPPLSIRLQWTTIPLATNYIYYRTNLFSTVWLPLTNFDHYYYGANVAVTNSAHTNSFVSPQAYPGPTTNVWVFDAAANGPRFYRVMVNPWLTYPY